VVVRVTLVIGVLAAMVLAAVGAASEAVVRARGDDTVGILATTGAIVLILSTATAGCTALVLHAREHRYWLVLSAASVVVAPVAAEILLLTGPSLALWLGVPILLVAPIAVALGLPTGTGPAPARRRGHALAGLVWVVIVIGGGWLLPVWLSR
jgi:hypothetical protein